MSDVTRYIEKRKQEDVEFAFNFEEGYTDFKIGILLRQAPLGWRSGRSPGPARFLLGWATWSSGCMGATSTGITAPPCCCSPRALFGERLPVLLDVLNKALGG